MATIIGNNRSNTLRGTRSDDVISGRGGNDRIDGDRGDDLIFGDDGNDRIDGGRGNDIIVGGSGSDVIDGDRGDDLILGGDGSDRIDGGRDNDLILAGSGNDIVDGGSGDDWIDGGSGNDLIEGGSGNDQILAGSGDDFVDGGSGSDSIDGGIGNDVVFGGDGNDIVDGGDGNDFLFGGTGDDALIGGAGSDQLTGGSGRDRFVFEDASDSPAAGGWDRITDFNQGRDKIDLSELLGSANLVWGNRTPVANGVWYQNSGSRTFVFADTNGDAIPDLKIELSNTFGLRLTSSDFIGVGGTPASNSIPIVANTDVTGAATELPAPVGNLTDSGTIAFTDADSADIHSVSAVAPSAGALGTLTASVTTDTTGSGVGGVVTWNYGVAAATVEFLAQGQHHIETFTFQVLDGRGGSVSRTVSIDIAGTNDAPVLTGDLAATVAEGASYTLTAADLNFTDPDDTAADVTFTVSGLTNGTLQVLGTDATSFTGTQLAAGEVTFRHDGSETTAASFQVAVEDGNEDTSTPTPSTFNLTVTPANDAPVINSNGGGDIAAVSVAENTTAVTAVTASDPDALDTHIFSISGGADATKFSINPSTGALSFLSAPDFETPTDVGANNVYDVTVMVTDTGSGSLFDTQAIAVTVTDVNNEAPVLTGDLAATVAEGASYTLTAADLNFTDPDDTAADVTFTVSGLTNGTLQVLGTDATSFTGTQLAAGEVTFRHDGSETTAASFQVAVEDGNEDTSTPTPSTFNLTVTPANDAPVINSNGGGDIAAVSVAENTTAVTAVTASDPDALDTHIFSISGGADATKFSINPSTGALSFLSAPDFETPTDVGANNVYDVTVMVTDTGSGSLFDTQAIAVTVTHANNAPVAGGNVAAAITEDAAPFAGTVPAATDADDEPLTYALLGAAPEGVVFNPDGTFSVAPLAADQALDAGETREVSFQYVANDGTANSTPATVTVTITGANDAPVAGGNVAAAITEDAAPFAGTVPAATDADDEPLTYALLGAAPEGVVFNPDGTFSVAPLAADQALDAGETREVSFQYVANDGTANSTPATVTVTITGANDAPVAGGNVAAAITEDAAPFAGTVPAATDADDEPLTYALLGAAPEGVVFNPDGTFSVAPLAADQALDAGETREVSFQYVANDGTANSTPATVTVTITGANDAPVAGGNVAAAITEDAAPFAGTVPAATDADDEPLTYALLGAAPEGVVFNPDGTFSVAPLAADQALDAGETREVSFQYVANDGTANSTPATVTVTITGANDAPVAGGNVAAAITEDAAPFAGTVPAATDADDEPLTYALLGAAPEGVVFNPDGTFSVAPLAADQALDAGETREVSFQYVANDGTANSTPATVTVTITGANDAPVAGGNVAAAITEDAAPFAGTVPAATDADDEPLTYALLGAAPEGVVFNPDGTFSVAPLAADQALDAGETREVSFQYVANDGTANSTPATVTVTITGANDAPVAGGNVAAAITEDAAPFAGTVPAATDADDEPLTYALLGAAPEGVVFNPDGTFSVAPLAADQALDAGETREVSFQYVANDGTANSTPATVTVTITGANDAPVAGGNVAAAITEDAAPFAGTVPAATDADDEPLTYALLGAAPEGVVFNPDGTFSVAPLAADQALDAGETREVSFQYVANDGTANSTPATVTVTITGVNDAPTNSAPVISVGNGDSDATGLDETNAGLIATGTLTITDTDLSDTNATTVVSVVTSGVTTGLTSDNAALQAMLTLVQANVAADPGDANNLTWNFDSGSQAFDYLATDEQLVLTYTVKAADTLSNDTQAVVITITGTNDVPVITSNGGGDAVNVSVAENTTAVTDVTAFDVDHDAMLTIEIVGGADSEQFTIDWETGALRFVSAPDFELPTDIDGDNIYEVVVQVRDEYDATDFQSIAVNVTGVSANNAPPVLGGTEVTGAVIEDAADPMLSAGGMLTFSDADPGDTHFATATKVSGNVGGTLNTSVNDSTGTVAWNYEVANANVQSLYDGETTSESFTLQIADGQGGFDTELITLTVTGVNDAPVITSNGGGDAVNVSVAENTTAVTDVTAFDVDHDAMLTIEIVGGADSEQFTIDWETGALRFVSAPDFELPTDIDGDNIYEVVVQVRDEYDATDFQSIAVNVTGELLDPTSTGHSIL